MPEAQLIYGKKDATKGGFQAIVEVEGDLESMTIEPTKFKDSKYATQLKTTLANAEVREVLPGEAVPDLKDDKFSFWYNYTKPGKVKPNEKAPVVAIYFGSFEEIYGEGKLQEAIAKKQRVRLRYGEYVLDFEVLDEDTGEEKPAFAKGFKFIPMEEDSKDSLDKYIGGKLVGKNLAAAKRELLLDAKAKRFPEYKEALKTAKTAEKLAERLGLALVDGVFEVVE